MYLKSGLGMWINAFNFFTPSFANVDGGSCGKIASSFLRTGRMNSKKILKFFTIQFRMAPFVSNCPWNLGCKPKVVWSQWSTSFCRKAIRSVEGWTDLNMIKNLTMLLQESLTVSICWIIKVSRPSIVSPWAFTHYERGTGSAPKSLGMMSGCKHLTSECQWLLTALQNQQTLQ